MTLHLKARDLMLAALLLALGVVIGLAFNAAPSRAQVGQCAIASGGAGNAWIKKIRRLTEYAP